MQKHVLVLTTSAFILACGAIPASAQQQPGGRMMQEQLERQLQGVQRRGVEDESDEDDARYGGGMMGRGYGRYHQGSGMMGGGMMGPGSMGRGMMMRMVFSLMDGDGDGTLSLEEFKAAHERIFKGMDADKDGRLTLEEMQAFLQGTRRSVPRQ
jgi:hypothetical protein